MEMKVKMRRKWNRLGSDCVRGVRRGEEGDGSMMGQPIGKSVLDGLCVIVYSLLICCDGLCR